MVMITIAIEFSISLPRHSVFVVLLGKLYKLYVYIQAVLGENYINTLRACQWPKSGTESVGYLKLLGSRMGNGIGMGI